MVDFVNHYVSFLNSRRFLYVPTISKSQKEMNVTRSETQFPLNVAYAVNMHRSQGLNLQNISADVGAIVLPLGAAFS